MRIVEPSIEIIDPVNGEDILNKIEKCGRTCYQSVAKQDNSSHSFVKMIITRGHESVLEHVSLSVKIVCDRGVSHELVRHRLASYSQESTRYCNYGNKEIEFVCPVEFQGKLDMLGVWTTHCIQSERAYNLLLSRGCKPENARSILPNSLKTEIVMTANLREWRHFIKLRASKFAHPDMRVIAKMILNEFNKNIPIVFDDLAQEFLTNENS